VLSQPNLQTPKSVQGMAAIFPTTDYLWDLHSNGGPNQIERIGQSWPSHIVHK
jgi:hypothetical protein